MIDYATQSRVTDPGRLAERLAEIPAGLGPMRAAARQLVFHYRAGGDYAENGIAADRIAEIDTRYAADMLARLVQLADQPLNRRRALALIDGEPSPEQLTLLDAMAAAICSSDAPAEVIESFYQRDEFRVPAVVTSFSPACGEPLQVAV